VSRKTSRKSRVSRHTKPQTLNRQQFGLDRERAASKSEPHALNPSKEPLKYNLGYLSSAVELQSSKTVFFSPTITLFVALVVPLSAATPALGAFLISVFAAAFAPPP